MPYTPPSSQQSPAASLPESPKPRRSQSNKSYGEVDSPSTSPSGSALPRSTSYLSRHRRTPSFAVASSPPAETTRSEEQQTSGLGKQSATDTNGSLHQAPSPVNNLLIPSGAVISPPNSSPSSSEDEGDAAQEGRQLENLAELKAAVRIIEQHREHKPEIELQIPNKDGDSSPPTALELPSLSKEARKISHSRSSTEDNILYELGEKQPETPSRSSDDSDVEDDELRIKPPMVRKKSGELVKPALRPSSQRRPSSMPGTPTYGKAVHFDSHLEHVRHFLKVDRPVAVSAGSSPVETHDGEADFPWSHEDSYRLRPPPFEWEIRLSNFPADTPQRRELPVRVERVFLSADNRNLIGSVAVANIAFHKFVAARFTLDYWKTTSEVVAEYNNDVRKKQINDGYDRFNFSIKLADQANLENKTMFFCVRYNVNGQEFWDSNGSINFQVDFSKKAKPQNGKQGMQGAAARPLKSLPRSRPSPPALETGRPRSMPISFDDFAGSFDNKYDFGLQHPPAKVIDESPSSTIRFKNPKPARSVIPEDANLPRTSPPGQAFGNRYDFSASLSAAINAANSALGERSGLKAKSPSNPDPKYFSKGNEIVEKPSTAQSHRMRMSSQGNGVRDQANQAKTNAPNGTGSPKMDALTSQKPSLQSSSYHELLDKYCFVRSRSAKEF
ncbi:MAG: hypothetical protein M1819_006683 [Sarea resinae]|nr:MAG: hypothetical protein M1819_006683 [Sarea resinae]